VGLTVDSVRIPSSTPTSTLNGTTGAAPRATRLDPLAAWRRPKLTREEAAFRELRLDKRDDSVADACMLVAIGYHAISLVTDRYIAAAADLPLLFRAHLVFLALHALWFGVLRHTRLPKRLYLWPLQIGFAGVMAAVAHSCVQRTPLDDLVMATTGLLAISMVMILMTPFHGRMIAVSGGVYLLEAVVALHGSPVGVRWLAVFGLATTAVTAMQYLLIARIGEVALLEFRTLRHVAPEQIVRGSVAFDGSIEESFRPEMRLCACLSTDWRNFQAYSRKAAPSDVARNLNDYYELAERLLREAVPEGNCYSDWMADELFVVIFAQAGQSERSLAEQALRFAYALVAAKPKFLETHAMPQAIDVGVVTGRALVGMMGPASHRKATALGETPGRARRYQSTGKFLRHLFGDEDRIVFGDESPLLREAAVRYQVLPMSTERKLRDLDTMALYYVEPRAKPIEGVDVPPPPSAELRKAG
jgi:hypothetical protein